MLMWEVQLKFLFRLGVYTFVGCLVLLENPLGMADASDAAFQRAHNRIFSPFYDNSAQDTSLAVIVSESSMKYLYENGITEANSWPLLYSDHILILEKILNFHPRAVFVDIYFKDKRSTDPSFEEFEYLLDDANALGIPLLFAKGYADEKLTEAQKSLDKYGGLTVNGWEYYSDRYTLKPHGENSVAVDLYEIACGKHNAYKACEEEKLDIGQVSEDEAIAVDWSLKPGRNLFPDRIRLDCISPNELFVESVDESFFSKLTQYISTGYNYLRLYTLDVDNPCLYTNTLPAETLISIVKKGSESELAQLQVEVEDKIIFYGIDIGAMTDEFNSPVHGLVPGVYRHSMALDNLITEGKFVKFKKDDALDFWDCVCWFAICLTVLLRQKELIGRIPGVSKYYAPHGKVEIAIYAVIPLTMYALFRDSLVGKSYESVDLLGYATLIGLVIALIRNEIATNFFLYLRKFSLPARRK